jgi:hypothetical protein
VTAEHIYCATLGSFLFSMAAAVRLPVFQLFSIVRWSSRENLSCQTLQFRNDYTNLQANTRGIEASAVAEVDGPQSGGAGCGRFFRRMQWTDFASPAFTKVHQILSCQKMTIL